MLRRLWVQPGRWGNMREPVYEHSKVLQSADVDHQRQRRKGEEIMTKQKEKRSPRSRERRGRDRWKAGRKWMQEDADRRLLPKYQHSR